MLKICSWCESITGWHCKTKGESHGICPECLKEFFPVEAALLSTMAGSVDMPKLGEDVPTGRIRKDYPIGDSFNKLVPAGLLRARKNLYNSGGVFYGNQ